MNPGLEGDHGDLLLSPYGVGELFLHPIVGLLLRRVGNLGKLGVAPPSISFDRAVACAAPPESMPCQSVSCVGTAFGMYDVHDPHDGISLPSVNTSSTYRP